MIAKVVLPYNYCIAQLNNYYKIVLPYNCHIIIIIIIKYRPVIFLFLIVYLSHSLGLLIAWSTSWLVFFSSQFLSLFYIIFLLLPPGIL